ncbi:MAG: hypothetical protein Q4G70_09520 [Pseudomonadota bacterium]|nr:hypothetical protein [Pseudomonadota bacterium]
MKSACIARPATTIRYLFVSNDEMILLRVDDGGCAVMSGDVARQSPWPDLCRPLAQGGVTP